MRTSIIMAAMGICLAVGLAAPASATPKDSVTVGLRVEPPGLDSTVVTSEIISVITLGNIHEGLTSITENNTVEPRLAKGWEVSDDGKVYTFQLHGDIKFADGSEFDSSVVKWNFERNAAEDSTNFNKAIYQAMESVETPDPYTVVVTLKEPNSLLPYRLGMGVSVIVSPESAETNATNPIGTGPFKLDRWVKGDSITLVRNDLYREPERVQIQRITFKIIEDPSAQVAALRAGDIDLFPLFGAPEAVAQLEADPNLEVLRGSTETQVVIGFNHTREPFTDLRVRRAVAHAIDREAMVEGAEFGFAEPIGSHFSVNHPAYKDTTDINPYDPDKANALLAEAGFENGFSTVILVPPQSFAVRGAEIAAAYLGQVGIDAQIDRRQWAQFLELAVTNNDFDMLIVDHIQSLDISIYARSDFIYLYDSPEFREIWGRVEAALSEEEQIEALQQAQLHVAQDLPTVPVYQTQNITVVRKGLKGVWSDMPHLMADMTDVTWEQ